MSELDQLSRFDTHQVCNQPPECANYNAFTGDRALSEALTREGGGWAQEHATALGAVVADEAVQALAREANRNEPVLRTHDRFGNRIDCVEFHPAWHELMKIAFGHGVHSLGWTERRPSAHLARAVLSYLSNQAESGINCPAGMTYASIPAIAGNSQLKAWIEKALSTRYDPRAVPGLEKTGITVGMAMTEKQGGSDLRQTQTSAEAVGRDETGEIFEITGHKWFYSVPQSDCFLTLARTAAGVSCFFVPRFLADGSQNRFFIQRLKDKVGNRSNASSEVEFHRLRGTLLGEEGHGIRHILGMAHLTRLDFAVGSAGLMRLALTHAIHHTTHRSAFGKPLSELPMMTNVLADLALEVEADTVMAMRIARATDRSDAVASEQLLSRIGTPMAKYWNCKRAPSVVVEALECHGGNGFIEDHLMARLYREAPLNAIWEGTSNMMCYDVLRTIDREPAAVDAFFAELAPGRSLDRRLDRFAETLQLALRCGAPGEGHARRLVGHMALATQANLLLQHAPDYVADTFCASRLQADCDPNFGSLPDSEVLPKIVARASVA